MRVLAAGVEHAYRTYAITLVTSARPSARRLAEARGILQTVRFGEPTTLEPDQAAHANPTTTTP